jgi:sugar phosphate isomerase/epimerase
MKNHNLISRRSFMGLLAAGPLAALPHSKSIPVGVELYSVRNELKKDLMQTVRAVAKMGFQCVEFYAPYYEWTPEYARQVRALLDELGIRCYSTHNGMASFSPEGMGKAIELNKILGTHFMVLADTGKVTGLANWKHIVETLNTASKSLRKEGLRAGYNIHRESDWKPVEGQKPTEVLAPGLHKSIMLQLDVGSCLVTGNDPVAWINRNPGRTRSMHIKDWSPEKKFRLLTGEGIAPWKQIFAAAEKTGGIEYYLIEQEASEYSELETVEKCLAAFRKLHG